jgi:hypothetical protein
MFLLCKSLHASLQALYSFGWREVYGKNDDNNDDNNSDDNDNDDKMIMIIR